MNDRWSNKGKRRPLWTLGLCLALSACSGGRDPFAAPPMESVADPRTVLGFDALYRTNCAGCHGVRGEAGVALGLASPGYLAVVSDATLRRTIADGRRGAAMPAFARSAGGMLTDAQIDALVAGVRAWAPRREKRDPLASACEGPLAGDATHGARVFVDSCGSCHRSDARGSKVNSIVDESFLTLVSDTSLCTTFVAGRPELGCPGARAGNGTTPTPQDVVDGVAWLAAQRKGQAGEPPRSAQAEVRKP